VRRALPLGQFPLHLQLLGGEQLADARLLGLKLGLPIHHAFGALVDSEARDLLGQVYEYFLRMFASAAGKLDFHAINRSTLMPDKIHQSLP
jgi:type I restriction-modification system DNA methylase subunit